MTPDKLVGIILLLKWSKVVMFYRNYSSFQESRDLFLVDLRIR